MAGFGLKAILMTLAMSASAAPAFAASLASVDDAAKCHAVLSLKLKENGLLMRERVDLYNAVDWFKAQGTAAGHDRYANLEVSYLKAYSDARENGDPVYSKAVKGCLTFHDAKTGNRAR